VAAHDIGGAITLHAHLLEGVTFRCIALIDSVVLRPWITPPTRHVLAYLDTCETMPTAVFEAIIAAHLRTATYHPVEESTLAAYLDQWKGEIGQRLYLQKDAQLDEDHTAELEPLLPSISVPVSILWASTTPGSHPPRPNACTNSSPPPTWSYSPRPATSQWKTARTKSPQSSSTSSAPAPILAGDRR